ncbi:MAG: aspartate/glutamate racemase family protein, partial [Candidatus Hodarchaeales archaeon]
MKKLTIGIVGGTTPQSTLEYYDYIIKSYIEMYNDHSYPEIIIYSVSFQNYINWMSRGEWSKIEDGIVEIIDKLSKAGADFAIIATNTLHKVYPGVQERTALKILSIIDCVADRIKGSGIEVVGLLGTRYTMEEGFYREGLRKNGIASIVPDEDEMVAMDEIIFNELARGIIKDSSREKFIEIIKKLESKGANG